MSVRCARGTAVVVAAMAALALAACGGDSIQPAPTGPEVTFSSTTAPASSSTAVTSPTDGTAPTATPTTAALGDPSVQLTQVFGTTGALDLAIRPDDTALYVVRQNGDIVRVDPADGNATPALDMTDLTEGGGERGLLGLAFHPSEPLAYVNYTRASDGATVIDEYRVGDDGVFDAGTRREVLTIAQPFANHNGGGLAFGPDGLLYIGTGDGGSADDPQRVSLNVSSLLGKMLRIDPRQSGSDPYLVPADNPFVGVAGARAEIWGVGLRNPWRFTFDGPTGDLWIADVGQNRLEELNRSTADSSGRNAGRGVNYGWSAFEGSDRFNDDQSPDGATPPLYEYPHGDRGCSVSGGAVYRGTAIPALQGWFVYGDYCSGRVSGLRLDGGAVVQELDLGSIDDAVAVKPGPDGELYAISLSQGVFRIAPA